MKKRSLFRDCSYKISYFQQPTYLKTTCYTFLLHVGKNVSLLMAPLIFIDKDTLWRLLLSPVWSLLLHYLCALPALVWTAQSLRMGLGTKPSKREMPTAVLQLSWAEGSL